MLPFNMSFPAESVVFVVDEYSQYKKAMIDDYCYTHSPIVISDIGQLVGKLAPPTNKNLLLDSVLKWDDAREYNHVAEVLRFHTTGLLMTMSKPAAFDPMIRAKVDYLVLFRGRNLRHLQRIYRQYLSSVLNDPTEFTSIFKSLGWGEGLVLDLVAMQTTGRFAGNYYKYSAVALDSCPGAAVNPDNTYANLDVALGDWIANGITNPTDTQPIPDTTIIPEHNSELGLITEDWELITTIDYSISRPAQPSSIPEIRITEEESLPPNPQTIPDKSETQISDSSLPEATPVPESIETINNTLPEQQETKNEILEQPSTIPVPQQQQQGWASYLYTKAWSLFA